MEVPNAETLSNVSTGHKDTYSDNQKIAILWFRRDLRLADNPALQAALRSYRVVVPVFIWAPEEEGQFRPGRCSRWWLRLSLQRLQADIHSLGSCLIIRKATQSYWALVDLIKETGAQAVYFNHLYDPVSLIRDVSVKQGLFSMNIPCCSFNSDLLYEPWEILDSENKPFTTHASFWNHVLNMPQPPAPPYPRPQELPSIPSQLATLTVDQLCLVAPEEPSSSSSFPDKWCPGEIGALEAFNRFVMEGLMGFGQRSKESSGHSENTSKLSPHLHFGEISVKYIWSQMNDMMAVDTMDQSESSSSSSSAPSTAQQLAAFKLHLGYREYSRYVSFHFSFMAERPLLNHLQNLPWRMNPDLFKVWWQGRTGYPLMDAALRQLWATGWMHARLRTLVASFLIKNLLLPWQWGLKHMWDTLVDADLETNMLGWQYVSGALTDGQPAEKMMDIQAESQAFDLRGEYVRHWIPSLARLPTEWIHCPWQAPAGVLQAAGVELGGNYPHRVITTQESQDLMTQAINHMSQSGTSRQQHLDLETVNVSMPTGYYPSSPFAVPSPSIDAQGGAGGGGDRVTHTQSSNQLPVGEGGGARGGCQQQQQQRTSEDNGASEDHLAHQGGGGGGGARMLGGSGIQQHLRSDEASCSSAPDMPALTATSRVERSGGPGDSQSGELSEREPSKPVVAGVLILERLKILLKIYRELDPSCAAHPQQNQDKTRLGMESSFRTVNNVNPSVQLNRNGVADISPEPTNCSRPSSGRNEVNSLRVHET